MTLVLPETLSVEDLDTAGSIFTDRQSARDLARDCPVPARPALRDRLTGITEGAVSLGLFRLRRHMAEARALGHSAQARAAHDGSRTSRLLDPYRLEVIDGDDLFFLVIHVPDGLRAPTRLTAFLEADMTELELALPDPVAQAIQFVLDMSDPRNQRLVAVLQNVDSALSLV